MEELKDIALNLYKPPFKLDHGYIFDSHGEMVADQVDPIAIARIRGWGRISYMGDAENLQDMVGKLIVEALNEKWCKELKE
jgi:hypothetical protein